MVGTSGAARERRSGRAGPLRRHRDTLAGGSDRP